MPCLTMLIMLGIVTGITLSNNNSGKEKKQEASEGPRPTLLQLRPSHNTQLPCKAFSSEKVSGVKSPQAGDVYLNTF